MFNVKTLEEAYDLFQKISLPKKTILINTLDGLGYTISEDILSVENVPAFDKSTVDGYACKYEDITLSSEQSPSFLQVCGEVEMGKTTDKVIQQGEAMYVPTGGFVPKGADCMVMLEHTDKLNKQVLVYKKGTKFENIVRIGQDIEKDTIFIKKHTKITSRVIGALMSQNIKQIPIIKPLSFTVISTGDEITNKDILSLGEVRDINSYTISSYIKTKNQEVTKNIIIKDDFETYKQSVLQGFLDSDIVISSGGSSVGEKDYTYRILKSIHADILLHGLNIKPGKPTIVATYNDKLFIGLPGHPLSAYIVLHLLLDTLLDTLYHQMGHQQYFQGVLTESVHNSTGRTMIQLVKVEHNNIIPLHFKSAMINVLKDADGYIMIDQNKEGYYKGDTVKVYKLGD